MAKLPSEDYLMQQIDGDVVLFRVGTEAEIVRYLATDDNLTAQAQKTIANSELGEEDKAFAHFWAGYFYAHGRGI